MQLKVLPKKSEYISLSEFLYTLCLRKKVTTFKLSVTLSNHKRFWKILHCWKA